MRSILRGGRVVDGTGAPAVAGDVEVVDGRIGRIGDVGSHSGAHVIDLDGLVLAPGFIDIHTHFDAQLFWDADFTPSCWHGVTTAIQGNCGFGIAPTRPHERDLIMQTLEFVEGMNVNTLRSGIDWCFETFPEYLSVLRERPKRINLGSYLGHTPVRTYVMGADDAVRRVATEDEVAQMRRIVVDAMEAGATGFSSSFAPSHNGAHGMPVPSRLADVHELRALCSAVADSGRGIVEITYGPQMQIEDAARWAEELGVRVTWGALLTGLFGPHGTTIEMLDRATAISGDIWPQVSCREIVFSMALEDPYYFGTAPSFKRVLQAPRAERIAVYRDRAWREEAKADIPIHRPDAYVKTSIAESVVFAGDRGRSLVDLARERNVHPFDLWLDIAIAEELTTRFRIVSRNADEVELTQLLRDPRIVLGAHDAGAHVEMLCDSCYPTHLLGYWVRQKQAISLEQAVWRLSGQPADLWRIRERGTIKSGYHADLVAFDPDTVAALPADRVFDFPANGDRLVSRSNGIHHIWVNGQATRHDGEDIAGAAAGVMV
ncbi:MAG TPA: amidohydrolase family protein [Acidimicrobiales bacterium]|nr:amidohydrolase family protein [Acidimicrobiales bacterium]